MLPNSIRSHALEGFSSLVAALNGDAEALLGEVGLSTRLIDNEEAPIPLDSVVNLFEVAATRLRCLDFGLRLAADRPPMSSIPVLDKLLRNAPTLYEMLRYSTRHQHLYANGLRSFFDEAKDAGGYAYRVEVIADGLAFTNQFLEHTLFLLHQRVSHATAGRYAPNEVWFSHKPVSLATKYARYFGRTRVLFGQEYDGVFVTYDMLNQSILGGVEDEFAQVVQQLERTLPPSATSFEANLREILQSVIRHGYWSGEQVASLMGVSLVTLKRRLQANGTSFEKVRDDVRRQLAVRYLARPEVPLAEIAYKLGYAELAVLSRSCRRWFALTAGQKRRELLGTLLATGQRTAIREVNTGRFA